MGLGVGEVIEVVYSETVSAQGPFQKIVCMYSKIVHATETQQYRDKGLYCGSVGSQPWLDRPRWEELAPSASVISLTISEYRTLMQGCCKKIHSQ